MKYTGISGKCSEVNSICYKSVDSATYLDSIDAMNYPVRAPYGTNPFNISYETWIKIKLRINIKYSRFLSGTVLQLPRNSDNCDSVETYTKIVNPRLSISFKCLDGYDIKYGITNEFRPPIKNQSSIAINSIMDIKYDELNPDISGVDISLTNQEIMLGDLDTFESDFIVTQLTTFKGCQFANFIPKVKLLYDLS